MKKKLLKYCKLVGILTLINYAITAMVCMVSGKLTWRNYSDTLMKSTVFVAVLTLLAYIFGFARKSHLFRKKIQNDYKSKEEIDEEKNEVLNISFILFGLAMTTILGSAIAAIFA